MRLQMGMAFELPTGSRLGSRGIGTGFILIPQGQCTGYLAYPFHNQEVASHTGNFNTTYLMGR